MTVLSVPQRITYNYYDARIWQHLNSYYRMAFAYGASQLYRHGHEEEARRQLKRITQEMPFNVIPGWMHTLIQMSDAYLTLGDRTRVTERG